MAHLPWLPPGSPDAIGGFDFLPQPAFSILDANTEALGTSRICNPRCGGARMDQGTLFAIRSTVVDAEKSEEVRG